MLTSDESACIYAALILHDDDIAITEEKIKTILKAANVTYEPYWPSLFSKALDGVSLNSMITNVGAAVAGAGGSLGEASPDAAVEEEKKEEKKEESEDSDGDDMGFGLFD